MHAKGVEDTACYRYLRLTALNEVGGDPDRFSLPPDAFHCAGLERAERFPHQLLTTTTHDTKRSADVRARIAALASAPGEWARLARAWLPGAPDANEGYLVLQTLVGAWPISVARLEEYLRKALREAKVNTSWLEPDERWEARALGFARGLVAEGAFVRELEALLELTRPAAELAALGAALLKLTAPGVPDLYNGDETEYLALVDPDNRRPVDWDARRAALAAGPPPKLQLVRTALGLRARLPDAFAGDYEPVGSDPHVCAFVRGGEVAVSVPLRPGASKRPPRGGWRDLLPGLPLGLYERTGRRLEGSGGACGRARPAASPYLGA